ncbi:MAG: hypothetical protein AAGF75_01530 [Cyanobacteria bacterium P01_H01_bin.130]
MARPLKMPANKAMKLGDDVWDIAIAAAHAKGVSPRSAVEGILRTCADYWVGGHCPQTQLAITSPATPEPFNASNALDDLIDSI